MMKVIFLHHSSFLVELDFHYLLFDYFAGDRVNGFRFTGVIPELKPEKPLFVFASHKHRDHFDMDNLKLVQAYPNVKFIFSKDCKMSRNFLKKHGYDESIQKKITYVAAERTYKVDRIEVQTLLSTDEGVAFVVKAEEKCIYHAGDLNWWYWEGAGDLVNGRSERGFKRALRKIESEHFQLAFVPLDSRQGADAFKGFGYFMKTIDADHVFPMHMWQDYSLITRFKSRTDNDYFLSRIVDITKENEVFSFG